MGWGAQSEGARNAPQLMEVNVNVVSLQACDAAYQNAVRDTQICAGLPEGGADACQGDSGGPLIVEGNTAADDVQVKDLVLTMPSRNLPWVTQSHDHCI